MAGFVGTAIGLSLQAKALAGGATSFTALATSLFTTACGGVSAALLAVMTFNLEAGIRRAATAKRRVANRRSESAATSMRDRSSIWIGLADLLLCVLSVVIVAVAPKEPAQSGVPEKAEYLMSAEWNVDIDADVDIWMIPPTQEAGVLRFARRRLRPARQRQPRLHGRVVTLADGSKVKVDSDKETISLRCIEPGHYDLGVNLYAFRQDGATQAGALPGRASRSTSRSSRSIPRCKSSSPRT